MKRRSLKQDKLAQVYDTEILPIWFERFGRMLLAEARVPKKGLVLNVACGTGYPALDLLERMEQGRIIAIDSSSALLDVAREKAGDLSGRRIFFRTEGGKEKLSFDSDVYDLTFSNLGLGELEGPPAQAIAELARVTAPEGQLLVTLPLRGTWSEFLDIYREVLTKHDRHDTLELLAEYEATLPDPDVALKWMEDAGLGNVDLVVDEFSLLFKSSREFFFAPVIEFGPLRDWKRLVGKGQEMQDIFWFIKEAIDAYFGGRAFSVTVVAGCLSGLKPKEAATDDEEAATVLPVARAPQAPAAPEENPAAELAAHLHDQPEDVSGLRQVEDELDGAYVDGFEDDEDTLAAAGSREVPPATERQLPRMAPPVRPEDFRPPTDMDADSMDVMVTHPRLDESSMPLLSADEVSIHELEDDDLEVLDETDLDGEEAQGDEDEVDTNVRRVDDLPDHLQKAIRDHEDDDGR